MGGQNSYDFVDVQETGTLVTIKLAQPDFVPYRSMDGWPIGGAITHFLRWFFGGQYNNRMGTGPLPKNNPEEWYSFDMTGPILETMCRPGAIPDLLWNRYEKVYPAMDTMALTDEPHRQPTNSCAVQFGK